MMALIIFGLGFIVFMTLIVIRISVSCMFWIAKNPKDKNQVFKIYFPYYIISLFGLCVVAIMQFDESLFAIYYFGCVFFISLLVWSRYLNKGERTSHQINHNVEPNHPKSP